MREEEEASEARTDDCSDEPGSQCMVAITGRRADCPIAVRSALRYVSSTVPVGAGEFRRMSRTQDRRSRYDRVFHGRGLVDHAAAGWSRSS